MVLVREFGGIATVLSLSTDVISVDTGQAIIVD